MYHGRFRGGRIHRGVGHGARDEGVAELKRRRHRLGYRLRRLKGAARPSCESGTQHRWRDQPRIATHGSPDDPADWSYLSGYSPYHLLQPNRSYPPTLLMTSTRDDRVHPGHARKTAAAMLEMGYDVRYFENVEGGHAGAADNVQTATKWAMILEFMWQKLA